MQHRGDSLGGTRQSRKDGAIKSLGAIQNKRWKRTAESLRL